jgi:hypothetical protein
VTNDEVTKVDREVEWVTIRGTRRVFVKAEVSARGNVSIESVVTVPAGERLYPGEFQTAERLGLYSVVRTAAGICATCSGAGRMVKISKTSGGRAEEVRVTCVDCAGSGRTK